MRAVRTMLIWCPDWPVVAARRMTALPDHVPLALIEKGLVFACSAEARREGVRRGLRVREAQARCPELLVQPYDPSLDHRAFDPVIDQVESMVPGVQLLRPGTCLVRARGPARYYGGEYAAASHVLRAISVLGAEGARVGVADGPFAAEQAARLTLGAASGGSDVFSVTDAVGIVTAELSAEFLAPMPIDVLDRPDLGVLLRRLGIRTLGDFAALDEAQVRDRFGVDGVRAHRLAAGRDASDVVARTPPPDLDAVVEFDPALERVDQIAFGFRTAAERFVDALTSAGLVATEIVVDVTSERGESVTRRWMHPRWFTASDVLDRVRWQIQGSTQVRGSARERGATSGGLESAISRVVVTPGTVDPAADHEVGLWGNGADERIHHGLSRIQSMLGHTGVMTAVLTGGRLLGERFVAVPWGDVPPGGTVAVRESLSKPWPGQLTGPPPATVFESPRPVAVTTPDGHPVDVDERGELIGAPARFSPSALGTDAAAEVRSWVGPWPVTERWWDAEGRRVHRFQLVDASGAAWLLMLDNHRWFAEGLYD